MARAAGEGGAPNDHGVVKLAPSCHRMGRASLHFERPVHAPGFQIYDKGFLSPTRGCGAPRVFADPRVALDIVRVLICSPSPRAIDSPEIRDAAVWMRR